MFKKILIASLIFGVLLAVAEAVVGFQTAVLAALSVIMAIQVYNTD